ncbi:hypothetical protein N7478_011152 [Penicillium angulare]|uniref:uncharacterized protein n=1 Tax=Penicillium angulare TaxID=116970 RepID=UPI0025401688|nr:uncharacterized protein N7478_011152 [Penicillium angulare]KAJ5263547.1 hypothetical protein N7478_011152 [Penicillium angulare]
MVNECPYIPSPPLREVRRLSNDSILQAKGANRSIATRKRKDLEKAEKKRQRERAILGDITPSRQPRATPRLSDIEYLLGTTFEQENGLE